MVPSGASAHDKLLSFLALICLIREGLSTYSAVQIPGAGSAGGGDLIKEGLEEVIIIAVHQHDFKTLSGEYPCGVDTTKPHADNDDPFLHYLHHELRIDVKI
jgi:hypothetical protein